VKRALLIAGIVCMAFASVVALSPSRADMPSALTIDSISADARVHLSDGSSWKLAGVDVPRISAHSSSCGASQARTQLSELLVGLHVQVSDAGGGEAWLQSDDGDASTIATAAGWASPHQVQDAAKMQMLIDASEQARAAHAGWWQTCS
jgi:hypothetical protein